MSDALNRASAIGQIMFLREDLARLLANPAISENESLLKSVAYADLKLAAVLTELKNAYRSPPQENDRASEWQPIETAPDDQILLVCGEYLAPTTAIKYTKSYQPGFYAAGIWPYRRQPSDELADAVMYGSWLLTPDYWMPMPAPPKETEND